MQPMSTTFPVRFDVAEPQQRNRMTVLLRIFYMIPHAIVLYIYGLVANIAVFVHWLIIVFTGKRNRGIFDFINGYLTYSTRVTAYGSLLHDQFPGFGPEDPSSPISYSVEYKESANRVSVLLRIIFAIPAMIITALYGIAAFVFIVIMWFTIVVTGKHQQSGWLFVRKVTKLSTAFNSYYYLQHDVNPMPNAVGMS